MQLLCQTSFEFCKIWHTYTIIISLPSVDIIYFVKCETENHLKTGQWAGAPYAGDRGAALSKDTGFYLAPEL